MNAARLKRLYGVTPADWAELTKSGRCPLCRLPYSTKPARQAVLDHSHITGEARGAPCSACNYRLGQLHEDIGWLRRAIEYLEHPPAARLGGPRRRAPGAAPS